MNWKQNVAALVAGFIFALGLGISGMTLPTKVQGFLDLFGDWDPSLGFVMGGAVVVYAIGYRLITGRPRPRFADHFSLPNRKDLTPRLIAGSALFGMGWGLAGLCPGPAVVATSTASVEILLFVGAMVAGFGIHAFLDRPKTASSSKRTKLSPEASAS